MIVVICSGGPSNQLCPLERFLNRDDVVFIGADKGAATLLAQGITPNVIIGDFDSIDQQQLQQLKEVVPTVITAQAEKDETDTDLALDYAISLNPSEIILTGVTGGRLDHEEAAKRSLLRIQLQAPHICCTIENPQNVLRFLITPNKRIHLHTAHRYVSFFAFDEDIKGVTLTGVKYETTSIPLPIMSSMFTSNELIGSDSSITFTNGICLMITSAD